MMNNLPPNWSWVKLGDVCKVKGGFAFKSTAYKKEGVPLVRISNITDKKVSLEDCIYIDSSFENKAKEFLLQKGDILIALSGATTGKYGIYSLEEKAFLNQRIGRLHFNGSDKIIPTFIYLYLEIIRAEILKTAYGAAQPNISPTEIADFPIPLPPLPEQKKIVEKIEELFSGLDSGVASLKKAKAQIRLYRQSVLASAFSGKLFTPSSERIAHSEMLKAAEPKVEYSNQLPEGWKWVKLGEVVESIRYGTSKKCYYEKEGKPVLRIPNIINGYINDEDLKYSEFNKNEIKDLSLIENDILIIRSNGSLSIVGKSAIVSNRHIGFLYAGYLIRIRLVSESYSSKFLNLLLSSNQLRSQIEFKAKSTSGVNNINTKEIQDLIIPFPPLKQQTQIVEEIQKRFSEADNLEKAIDESLAKSETLRQSILKQAFEGRLV